MEGVEAEEMEVEKEAEAEDCASSGQASQKPEEAPPAWPEGAVEKVEVKPEEEDRYATTRRPAHPKVCTLTTAPCLWSIYTWP